MLRRVPILRIQPLGFMPYHPVASNPFVFFDISIEGEDEGRVAVELFADLTPSLAENMRSLCTGERGYARWLDAPRGRCPLFYKGVPFHRIIHGFIVQGGDILYRDGRGNESAFGYPLPDEFPTEAEVARHGGVNKALHHRSGTVALAHTGPDQNGSQFFFNLKDSPHLDGKFVVVGQVVDGWDVVSAMSKCGSRCGVPVSRAWITHCGQTGGTHHAELAALEPTTRAPFSELVGDEVIGHLRPR